MSKTSDKTVSDPLSFPKTAGEGFTIFAKSVMEDGNAKKNVAG